MESVMSPTTKNITTNDRPVRPVPNDGTDACDTPPVTAETKVHVALHDNPGATTTELAKVAGVGRSTAAKILARWAAGGVLIRTAGKDQWTPDTWTISETTEDATTDGDGTADYTRSDSVPHPAPAANDKIETKEDGAFVGTDPAAVAGTSGDDNTADDTEPPEVDPGPTGITSERSLAAVELAPATTDRDDSVDEPDAAPRDSTNGDAAVAPVATADEPVAESSGPSVPAATTTGPKRDRLPKGMLYELVKAYLAERPGDSFGPAKISTDLSRSSGAVSNALDKLVIDGSAIKTCEAPKRFALKSDSAGAE
jgi:DNA-binding MarR family transcriptional regulator